MTRTTSTSEFWCARPRPTESKIPAQVIILRCSSFSQTGCKREYISSNVGIDRLDGAGWRVLYRRQDFVRKETISGGTNDLHAVAVMRQEEMGTGVIADVRLITVDARSSKAGCGRPYSVARASHLWYVPLFYCSATIPSNNAIILCRKKIIIPERRSKVSEPYQALYCLARPYKAAPMIF